MNSSALRSFRLRPLFAVAVVATSASLLVMAGCDKTKEEPVPPTATVIMPASPPPSDAASAATAGASGPVSVTAGDVGTSPVSDGANGGGSADSAMGGTVSVLPSTSPSPLPATGSTGASNGTTASTPATPADNVALPPARSASRAGPGAIGPNPSAVPNDQPPSVAPGNKP